ncbi:hypothetical protein K0B96_15590 [Horticoccus luteus]|uniref:Uncharacterized protein n=1 Tax=Horticoccus luteus TaxID=2862869 RepID=A0A8F9TT27_9BACT|nr:hypothetical protein [Horticoccus luteus]QYM78704.1 hypothetical protein K0B96_15590 [Horticoccus luteus]
MSVFTATGLGARERRCEINVNGSVTEAGRRLARPTPERPAYYFPLLANWRTDDAVEPGEKPPAEALLTHPLVRALAQQGYRVATAKTPPPTLLLVFYWGAVAADSEDMSDDPDAPDPVLLNAQEMLTLVGASEVHNLQMSIERQRVLDAAAQDRFFVIVTAYDYADARKKTKTELWQARMSTPAQGVEISDVVQALVESGAPQFGRESSRPVWVKAPVRTGHVELGEAMVVPETPASPRAREEKSGASGERRAAGENHGPESSAASDGARTKK